jgi:predicted dehydrogenase
LVVGTGSIGRRHISNLRKLRPNTAFALLRKDGRGDDFSRELQAEVFSNLEDAIAWEPQLAIIASPSDRHAEVLPALLDAKIACFIEKPVVVRKEDADDLESRPPATLPATQVGCVLRFLGAVETLRSWLEAERLGKLARARFECGQYLPDWRPGSDYRSGYSAHAQRGGGVIFDLVHEIDLAVLLFGDCRLEHVMGAKRSSLDIACEDVALLHLSGDDGLPISISLDYVSRTPVRSIEIIGEAASARLDFVARQLTLSGADGELERVEDGFDVDAAFRLELLELLNAGEDGRGTRLPLHEGLRATQLAIAAHDAVHSKGLAIR